MTTDLKRRVRRRASGRCEYCKIPVRLEPFGPQVDHVIALKHRGETILKNLALACAHCNIHKGTDIAGIDPVSGTLSPLFHPRTDVWDDHFRWRGPVLVGKTPTARATIYVLAINAERRISVRMQLMAEGVY